MDDDDDDLLRQQVSKQHANFCHYHRQRASRDGDQVYSKLARATCEWNECRRMNAPSDEANARRFACLQTMICIYYDTMCTFPAYGPSVLEEIEAIVASLRPVNARVIFNAVQVVAQTSDDMYGFDDIERVAEAVFKDVPCVDVFDSNDSFMHVRSTTEMVICGESDVLMRWLLRTGRMSVNFGNPVLHCIRNGKYNKLKLVLKCGPDVFAPIELRTSYDPYVDKHYFLGWNTRHDFFDTLEVSTVRGSTLDVVEKIWTNAHYRLGDYNRWALLAPLERYANVKRVAQLFVCLKRTHVEAILTIANMSRVRVPPPSTDEQWEFENVQ